MLGPHIVHFIAFQAFTGIRRAKTVLIPVFSVPIPVFLFPILHRRIGLLRSFFCLVGEGVTFSEKLSLVFVTQNPVL